MAVNAAGQFTGQWLFDAVIVTTQDIDGKDIMDTSLTGANLTDLLSQEFADAAALDQAAAALAQQYGAPPRPIQVALALPWLDPQDTSVTVPGRTFNLSTASSRVDAADWYLGQVQAKAQAAHWSELSLYGVYNQRGVRATLAGGHPASDWCMVSELSTQLPGGGRTRLMAPTRNTIST